MRAVFRTLLRLSFALSMPWAAGCVDTPQAFSELGAITMGSDAPGDLAVAALVPLETPDQAWCSATLVAPRVLLTAAHCELEAAPEAWEAFFGTSLAEGGTRIPVLFALPHPDYDGDADDDLELVLLAEPAPVEPVAIAESAPSTTAARLVGFGFTGPGAADAERKREGTTSIADVQPRHVVLAAAPSLPCSGDSGGPLLIGPPGAELLAGVVSRGDPSCASVARATRVDVHVSDFLQPTIEAWAEGSRAEGERCLYDAQCERGACITAADEPLLRYCGGACVGDDACAAPMRCSDGSCRHALPTPGALGAACGADEECARGECVADEGYCSVRCTPSRDDCPVGSTCAHVGSIDFFCAPDAPAPSCACRSGREPLGVARALALGVLALTTASHRRRAARGGAHDQGSASAKRGGGRSRPSTKSE